MNTDTESKSMSQLKNKQVIMRQDATNSMDASSEQVAREHSAARRTQPPVGSRRQGQFIKWSGLTAVVWPVLFVLLFTVAGFLRPSYSPVSQAVSDLGVGPMAWLLNVPTVILGLVMIALAIGFFQATQPILSPAWRWIAAILIAVPGFGYIVGGFFTEDPSTLQIHWMFGAMLGLYFPVITFFVVGLLLLTHRVRGYGIYSLITAVTTMAAIVVTSLAFWPGSALYGLQVSGLAERVDLVVILSWYVVIGWRLYRAPL
jgi:hypothetical membrane protein